MQIAPKGTEGTRSFTWFNVGGLEGTRISAAGLIFSLRLKYKDLEKLLTNGDSDDAIVQRRNN